MWDLRQKVFIWLGFRVFFVCLFTGLVFAKSTSNSPADELIQKIMESERRIHDVELHYDYLIMKDGRVRSSFDWGYEGGKEYYAGEVFQRALPNMDVLAHTVKTKVAFDGEKIRRFEHSELGDYSKGRICPYKPGHFSPFLRPNDFLGHRIVLGLRTFGEILRDAPRVSVRPELEVIDGHPCQVLEVIGLVDRVLNFDVRVWIDTERDFRPLRIEKYHGIGGQNRWQILACKMEKIKLEKIDGVWFPVDGTALWFYTKKILPPEGMTEADLRRLPEGKWKEVSKYIQVPNRVGPVRLRAYTDTVRINKGIDPGKFTIEFPQGCRVYDDFLQLAYVVGQPDAAVDRAILEEIANFKPKTEAGEPNDLPGKDPNLSRTKPPEPNQEPDLMPNYGLQDELAAAPDNSYAKYVMPGIVILIIAGVWIALRKRITKSK